MTNNENEEDDGDGHPWPEQWWNGKISMMFRHNCRHILQKDHVDGDEDEHICNDKATLSQRKKRKRRRRRQTLISRTTKSMAFKSPPSSLLYLFSVSIFIHLLWMLLLFGCGGVGSILAQAASSYSSSSSSSSSSSPSQIHSHHYPHHPYGQSPSSSSSAAIVRRLYSGSPGGHHSQQTSSSSPLMVASRQNPYRSMIHGSSGPPRLTPPSQSSSSSSLPLPPKGIAKVTPISLQSPSFDSNIRLANNRPLTLDSYNNDNQKQLPLLQKTSTSLIKVLEIGSKETPMPTNTATTTSSAQLTTAPFNNINIDNNQHQQASNDHLDGALSFSLVTPSSSSSQSSPPSFSSRQGKSIGAVILNSSSNNPTSKSPTTLAPPSIDTPALINNEPMVTTATMTAQNSSDKNDNDHQAEKLCFLSHGGSSETFTVNEAMPVNSIIGTIKVFGDVSHPNGNIELSIIHGTGSGSDQNGSTSKPNDFHSNITTIRSNSPESSVIPIRIEPGTKNLILARKLDKESVEGESSVTISVRCRPKTLKQQQKRRLMSTKKKRKLKESINNGEQDELDQSNSLEHRRLAKNNELNDDEAINDHDQDAGGHTQSSSSYWAYETSADNLDEDVVSDDDIIIPIRILVTDANDNKPEWQGQVPYSVNISEMTTIGSVVMTGIRAVDNDQLGPYSTVEYYVEPGPYSHLLRFASPLEGTLILSGQLDYETLPQFGVSIRAQDQGNPPNTAVTKVNVQVLDADDQNPRFEVDKYTAILGEGQKIGQALSVKPKAIKAEDPDRGIQSKIVYEFNSKEEDSRENAYFRIDSKTGQVSLRRPLHSSITLPITLVIRATQMDNPDRYALTTLTIVSKHDQTMPDLRFMHSNYSTSLLESTPPGQVVLTVQTTKPTTTNSPLRFQILDDEEGYFSVKNTGEIVVNRMLDYEKHHRYSFRLMVTDGRQTDLARITVDIINVNEHDPVFTQSAYVFHVNEARLRLSPVIGQLQATDADDGDRIQLSLSGPHSAAFALSTDGTLRLRSLRLVNSTECHMIATATDSGSPPRSSSASVVVKFAPQLLKSLTGRTLETLLFDLEQEQNLHNDLSSSSAISPTAVDILQHSAANIFSASTNSTALVLVIVLGVLLGTLFIIIVALTLHVLKNRKYQSRRTSNCSPVTLHHRHHPSSSSSSSSSTSSSSDLSLNGTETAHMTTGHHGHLGHSHHHHLNHNHHWSDKQQTMDNPNKKQQQHFFQQTSSALTNGTGSGSSTTSLLRSNKIVPLDCDAVNSNNRQLQSTQQHEDALDKFSQQQNDQQQPDSAISSGVSCWSSSDNNQSPKTSHQSLINQQTTGGKSSSPSSPSSSSSSSSSSDSSGAGLSEINGSRTNHHHSPHRQHLNSNQTMSTNNGTVASRISVIRWPQGSIPRRVKKLTWKDEQRNNEMDQLYTGNTTIVQAPNSGNNHQHSHLQQQILTKTKTKTLGGHLLTGQLSILHNNPVTSSSSALNPRTISSSINENDLGPGSHGIHHYHLHHNSVQCKPITIATPTTTAINPIPMIRHHQTPHYPLAQPNSSDKSSHQLIINHNGGHQQHSTGVATQPLPDLTVYF